MANIMPTMCEAIAAQIPHGVQGRSLWPVLQGQWYPQERVPQHLLRRWPGWAHYEDNDDIPTSTSHDSARPGSWDELNKVT